MCPLGIHALINRLQRRSRRHPHGLRQSLMRTDTVCDTPPRDALLLTDPESRHRENRRLVHRHAHQHRIRDPLGIPTRARGRERSRGVSRAVSRGRGTGRDRGTGRGRGRAEESGHMAARQQRSDPRPQPSRRRSQDPRHAPTQQQAEAGPTRHSAHHQHEGDHQVDPGDRRVPHDQQYPHPPPTRRKPSAETMIRMPPSSRAERMIGAGSEDASTASPLDHPSRPGCAYGYV